MNIFFDDVIETKNSLDLFDNVIYTLDNLFEDWRESKKDIYYIADFHQKFEHIHPFQDGNGKIGRFIAFRQCLENNIDLIVIDDEYNKEYKESLYKAQTIGNIGELVHVFEKCQNRLDEKLKSYISVIEKVAKEVD